LTKHSAFDLMGSFLPVGQSRMLARINFLLGTGLLILSVFYFAGSYLIVRPLAHFAPEWGRSIAGIAVLAACGFTVQLLSMVMSDLRGIALYGEGERPGALSRLSQAAMVCGHAGMVCTVIGLLLRGEPVSDVRLLIVAALYFTGTALAVVEWRQRKRARN
jgi:hypothetical protein